MNTRICLLILIVSLVSCKKDKLTGDYNSFEGNFEWDRSTTNDKNISSSNNFTITPKTTGYTVSIVLNSSGEVIFYKNGIQITKNKYTITEKENSSYGNGKISIKLKGEVKGMTISKSTLTLRLSGDTLLSVDEFPFPAIDNVANYKSGHGSNGNSFLKK